MNHILNYEPSELGPIFDHKLKKIAEEFHIIHRVISSNGGHGGKSVDALNRRKGKTIEMGGEYKDQTGT